MLSHWSVVGLVVRLSSRWHFVISLFRQLVGIEAVGEAARIHRLLGVIVISSFCTYPTLGIWRLMECRDESLS